MKTKTLPVSDHASQKANWFQNVPRRWRIARIGDIAKIINGYPFESSLFHPTEGIPLIRIRDITRGETETYYSGPPVQEAWVQTGDVIIGMDGDFNVARWTGPPAMLNQRLCVVRAESTYLERFLAYVLPMPLKIINDLTYSTTVKHLSSFEIQKIRVPLPDPLKIEKIVHFLDSETAKTDALLAEYARLVELLEEKRVAMIMRAVSKGLSRNTPMKDSAAAWIGRVPEHWQVEKTKFVATLKSGHTPSRNHPEYWVDCDIPWVTLSDVSKLRDERLQYVEETNEQISALGLANSAAELLPARTVIVSRTASVGYSAVIARPMATTQDFVNWVCGPKIIPEYLLAVFRAMKSEFARLTNGSVHQTIYMPDVRNFVTPVPPLDEQQAIVAHVEQQSRRIFNMIDMVREAIALLHERRSALITAVVTGQLDVPSDKSQNVEEVVA